MRAFFVFFAVLMGTQAYANTCFFADRIWDFRVVNDRTLVVREAGNRRYRVTTNFCRDLQWARRILFRPWGAGSWTCWGDDILIYTSLASNRPDDICRIDRITAIP